MVQFSDCLDRPWTLHITVADLKPLKAVGFTFTAFIPDTASAILFDPEHLMKVLRVMAHVPAETTDDDFHKGFDGPAMQRAGEAVLEACVNFSPHSRLAAWLNGRFQKGLEVLATATAKWIESNPSVSNSPAASADSPPSPSAP